MTSPGQACTSPDRNVIRLRRHNNLSVLINFDHACLSTILLSQRWIVYTEKLQPVQQRNIAHFGFVDKDLVVSSFALTKIVICKRKLLLLFVKVVVYIPSVLRIRNWLNYGWLKTK